MAADLCPIVLRDFSTLESEGIKGQTCGPSEVVSQGNRNQPSAQAGQELSEDTEISQP